MVKWIISGCLTLVVIFGLGCCGSSGTPTPLGNGDVLATTLVVFGYNDLGMHCMNQDFSRFMILPPFNTMHALVLRRGEHPQFVTSGVTVNYNIPGNTSSVDKTNFWQYAQPLLGVSLAPNIGLAGNGLSGMMTPSQTTLRDWQATGIPLTPITDAQTLNSFQLANIEVRDNNTLLARTQAVAPVSWEISCDLCHNGDDAPDILLAHDQLHGTNLQQQTPVLCGKCHAQAPLGSFAPGQPGVKPLSTAMHSAHASRMADVVATLNGNTCYACHPGRQTKCLRDVHASHGMTCTDCHTSMEAVGNPARRPWVEEPRCGNCHPHAEQPNTLYRNSVGHHGVACEACHGSPHAITPTSVANDNVQAIGLQGHAGVVNTCSVCHQRTPDDTFSHNSGN